MECAGLVQNAAVRGEQLREVIRSFESPLVHELRGQGLLIGVGLTEPVAGALVDAALANGLIVNAANDSTLRIAPPLIIGNNEVREFGLRMRAAFDAVGAARPDSAPPTRTGRVAAPLS